MPYTFQSTPWDEGPPARYMLALVRGDSDAAVDPRMVSWLRHHRPGCPIRCKTVIEDSLERQHILGEARIAYQPNLVIALQACIVSFIMPNDSCSTNTQDVRDGFRNMEQENGRHRPSHG